ncbi:MAG: ABC transporter permease, partial [Bdellovibrionia bacterium]
MESFFAYTGQQGFQILRYLGGIGYLMLDILYFIFVAPFGSRKLKIRTGPIYTQMARVGYSSLGVVSVVLLFMGMVLALQMAYILKKFGVTEYVGAV